MSTPNEKTAPATFHGLRTAVYSVGDLDKAKAWYAEALGVAPYYDTEYYVGFNIGGYEFGLHPGGDAAAAKLPATVVAYWGVDDPRAVVDRLVSLGATVKDELQDVGGDILIGSVYDPFGNIFGVIKNPHFHVE